jgi:FKBP12-rapamycin complex-associated protein
MLNTLLPLHEMMRKQGPTTLKEIAFSQASPDCLAHRTPA